MSYTNIKSSSYFEKVLVPMALSGNYFKISETLIEDLFCLPNRKKKHIISTYLYLKTRLNESYSNRERLSIREVANALNTNTSNIHSAIKELKKLNTDIQIKTNKNGTIVSNISDSDGKTKWNYVKFEKSTLKKIFNKGINYTAIYSYIYVQIHKIITYSKLSEYHTIIIAKELSKILHIDKDIINKSLNVLESNNLITKKTKRKIGSIISLRNDYVDKKYIDKSKIINRYREYHNPTEKTPKLKLNRYREHKSSQNPKTKSKIVNIKKPILKKTFLKKPKEKEKVFLKKFKKNNLDQREKINMEIKNLEKKKKMLIQKMNLSPNLSMFRFYKSNYYDGKKIVYELYFKDDKLYVKYGYRIIDIDDYIADVRDCFKPDQPSYIHSPKKWKKSYIRDFNFRKNPKTPNNFELRIINYVRKLETEIQETIPNAIKSLYIKLNELSPLNKTVKDCMNKKQKNKNLLNLDKIKNFEKFYPDAYSKISGELTSSINKNNLNVSPEYFIDMFIRRIDFYIENENSEITFDDYDDVFAI